jgi:hypothetical protein
VRALTVQPGRSGSGAVRVVPDPEPAEGEVLVLGTVNAKSDDFQQGITDLADAERRWPGFLGALITRRVPLADAARALPHDPSQIKTVVEVHP